MLSDEEKKAIEYWKTHMKILHWNTQLASEHYIKVLLDLIEKQSKEIEELKDSNNKLYNILQDNKQQTKYSLENNDKKWEDKIKAKIEELQEENNNMRQTSDFIIADVLQPQIRVLKELLEANNE